MDRSKLSPASDALLDQVMAATKSDRGYMFGRKADFQELIDAGFVVFRDDLREGKGVNVRFAMRVADEALSLDTNPTAENEMPQNTTGTSAAEAAKPKSSFIIRDDVPLMPVSRPRGGDGERESKYPFDDLQIRDGAEWGQSFHVAKSAEMEDPAKTMASSVSAAKRRWYEKVAGTHKNRKGTETPNYKMTRNFVMREVGEKDPEGPGVRIYRYKLPENPVFDKDTFKVPATPETPPAAPPAA